MTVEYTHGVVRPGSKATAYMEVNGHPVLRLKMTDPECDSYHTGCMLEGCGMLLDEMLDRTETPAERIVRVRNEFVAKLRRMYDARYQVHMHFIGPHSVAHSHPGTRTPHLHEEA